MAMTTLQQITDAWGQIKAGAHDKPAYTASTVYSGHRELAKYTPCKAVAGPVVYAETTPVQGKVYLSTQKFINNTTATATQRFAHTDSYTEVFSWELTTALSLGVTVSAEAGVPTMGTVSESVTMQINLGASTTSTTQNTHEWTVDTEIPVPPQSQVVATMEIDTGTVSTPFTAPVTITGQVVMRLNSNRHHDLKLVWAPIDEVLQMVKAQGQLDLTGYEVGPAGSSSIVATSSGSFCGTEGVSVSVQANQYPLNGSTDGTPQKTVRLAAQSAHTAAAA